MNEQQYYTYTTQTYVKRVKHVYTNCSWLLLQILFPNDLQFMSAFINNIFTISINNNADQNVDIDQ